jgi:hypothetical protein
VLVLLADEQRFELPAGFSVRVREILARNSKKQNADRPAGHELPIPKSFRVSTGHEKSDSRVDLFSGGTAGANHWPIYALLRRRFRTER